MPFFIDKVEESILALAIEVAETEEEKQAITDGAYDAALGFDQDCCPYSSRSLRISYLTGWQLQFHDQTPSFLQS